jgi:hypothetical protein
LLFGQYALMQDTGNQNAAGLLPVKHNMLALLHATQPRANFIAQAAQRRIVGNKLATIFKLADIAVGLGFTPGAKAIKAEFRDIAWWAHERGRVAAELDSHRQALDLNALFPIPLRVLRKGFAEAGQEWMWRNWGVHWPIRRVKFAMEQRRVGQTGVKPVAVFRFAHEQCLTLYLPITSENSQPDFAEWDITKRFEAVENA